MELEVVTVTCTASSDESEVDDSGAGITVEEFEK